MVVMCLVNIPRIQRPKETMLKAEGGGPREQKEANADLP